MHIIVNGDRMEVEPTLTLVALLAQLGVSASRVAIEHNGKVIEPDILDSVTLGPSDQLELVHFVGGG